jgi:hypothetical protein
MLPQPGDGKNGLVLDHFAPASSQLLDDLRADKGMEWIPQSAWLTQVRIDAAAPQLRFDLAIDASGQGTPSRVAAGLPAGTPGLPSPNDPVWVLFVAGLVGVAAWIGLSEVARRSLPPASAAS